MKARKWRPSLLHLGKPLLLYNFSCQQLQAWDGPEDMSFDITLPLGQSDSVRGLDSPDVVHTQGDATLNVSRITTATESDQNHTFLVDPFLLFVKAFCLRCDKGEGCTLPDC